MNGGEAICDPLTTDKALAAGGNEAACRCRGYGFEPRSGKTPPAAERLRLRTTTAEARVLAARAPQETPHSHQFLN